jgi:hypothetical protein
VQVGFVVLHAVVVRRDIEKTESNEDIHLCFINFIRLIVGLQLEFIQSKTSLESIFIVWPDTSPPHIFICKFLMRRYQMPAKHLQYLAIAPLDQDKPAQLT